MIELKVLVVTCIYSIFLWNTIRINGEDEKLAGFWKVEGQIHSNETFLSPHIETASVKAVNITLSVKFKASMCTDCQPGVARCCPQFLMFSARFFPQSPASCHERFKSATGKFIQDTWRIELDPSTLDSGCQRDNTDRSYIKCKNTRALAHGVAVRLGLTFAACDSRIGLNLNYSISFQVMNESQELCEEMIPAMIEFCGNLSYRHVMMPGALGYASQADAFQSLGFYTFFLKTFLEGCHQHALATACLMVLPECLNGRRILPCREMCENVVNACSQKYPEAITVRCDNFVTKDSGIPCFYEPVTCTDIRQPENGRINVTTDGEVQVAHYSCLDGYFPNSFTERHCSLMGTWNGTEPKCIRKKEKTNNTIAFAVSFSIAAVILTLILLVVAWKRGYIRLRNEKINIQGIPLQSFKYDIFVSYSSWDEDFVEVDFLRHLEESQNPPFRVCLHGRDFLPGEYIICNIMKAIEDSAAYFVMLSRHYIQSSWCTEEFSLAYSRMINDKLPKYRLQVILLEEVPVSEMPISIRAFCQSVTYIKRDDPKFWQKVTDVAEFIRSNSTLG